MSEPVQSRRWIGPAFGGLVVGAVITGGPLGYQVISLQTQLRVASEVASAAALESHGEMVGLRAQLDDTTRQLRAELDTTRSAAASTAHQLEEQRALSAELAKPDIPLQLSVRKGILDAGYVLMIRNPTPHDIVAAATFQSPNGQSLNARLVVGANIGKDIGESEGWAFASRDTVTLRVAGHKDLIYMVPLY